MIDLSMWMLSLVLQVIPTFLQIMFIFSMLIMCIFVSYSLSASNVEVSKYLISSSFQINLHIIVLSRNVMGPL